MYSLSFLGEYLCSGDDDAPSEIEADKGYLEFIGFNRFVSNNYGSTALKDLFESELSEQDKVSIIDIWWNDYKKMINRGIRDAAACSMVLITDSVGIFHKM